MLHNNSCNVMNLRSCHFYKTIIFKAVNILFRSVNIALIIQLLYKPHCTWIKKWHLIMSLHKASFVDCPVIKAIVTLQNYKCFLKKTKC